MQYKEFKGLKLSALGAGAMRLPVLNKKDADIDEKAASKMLKYAYEHGVNYFDTAYDYHGGNSEIVVGKALKDYPRDSYYLADKFPGYNPKNLNKVETIFEEQLKRCDVEYFDFYLLHNLYEKNVEPYLDKKYGILDYLMEQKKKGRIRYLGFSTHARMEALETFLNGCGKEMEFCQIQLNYLDWDFQNAKKAVELLNKWNIPIWVMEPLRGGQLVKLSEADIAKLKALRPEETIPAWAFRFLQTVPGVAVTLSGMSSLEQMKENLATYEEEKPLDKKEWDTLIQIAQDMVSAGILPCTGCRYCVSHCPKELDIPLFLSLYNEHTFSGGGFIAPMAVSALPKDKRPAVCIGCRSCEEVCPQQLKISEVLADFVEQLKKAF